MLDIFDEFKALIAALNEAQTDYALCGGLAMAVYGTPRATVDIDLLIPASAIETALAIASRLGFTMRAQPMMFAEDTIEIHRITKLDPTSEDVLMLDLLLVTPALEEVWRSRVQVRWDDGPLWVVSIEGLITLKQLRGSGQDRADIEHLCEIDDED